MRYMCDFETTAGDEWLIRDNNVARIWAWCSCCISKNPKKFNYGTTLNSFFQWCFKSNKTLYFHNLAYDGEYIISYLLNNGFKFTNEKELNNMEFKTLISEQNAFYTITIKKDDKRIKIFDSLKIIPLSVEKIAEAWNMEQGKGDIDYTQYRPIGHKLTLKEKQYIKLDVKIVAVALADFIGEGYKKMTIGSNAFTYFQELISKRSYKNLFPILPLDVDNDIRLAYKGGYVYLNPKYANQRLKGISFDVNSLYPYEMHERVLPFGLPLYYKGKYKPSKNYPLYIQKLNCRFILKDGMLPTIQLKNNSSFLPTQYITDSEECVDLVLTNVDLELFLKHYDVFDIEWLGGYKFHGTKMIFNEYIDHFMEIKANTSLKDIYAHGTVEQVAVAGYFDKDSNGIIDADEANAFRTSKVKMDENSLSITLANGEVQSFPNMAQKKSDEYYSSGSTSVAVVDSFCLSSHGNIVSNIIKETNPNI